jgi:hypothetical protein
LHTQGAYFLKDKKGFGYDQTQVYVPSILFEQDFSKNC